MLHSKRGSKTESGSSQTRARRPSKPRRIVTLARSGTKQEAVLSMLRRPNGATIAAIVEATGWQKHSVRGFIAGVVRKRLKLKLVSKTVDGNRVYQVASGSAGNAIRKRQSNTRAA